MNSCILQIASFSYKHLSLRATVLLCFPLLKTTESCCSQGSIDSALRLHKNCTNCFFFVFLFFVFVLFWASHFAKQSFVIHNCYNFGHYQNKKKSTTRQNYSKANLLSLLGHFDQGWVNTTCLGFGSKQSLVCTRWILLLYCLRRLSWSFPEICWRGWVRVDIPVGLQL